MNKGILISGLGKTTKARELSLGFSNPVFVGGNYNGINIDKCEFLTEDTDLIVFDDTNFPFKISSLYSIIKDGVDVKRKYKNGFHIHPQIIVCNPGAIIIETKEDLENYFDRINLQFRDNSK